MAVPLGAPSDYLRKNHKRFKQLAESFEKGLKGESAIYFELLLELPGDYYFIPNVEPEELSGDIDFVVFGPTGIFALDVKNWGGIVKWDGKNLWNRTIETNAVNQIKRRALMLSRKILEATGKKYFVAPVLVFPDARVIENGESAPITFRRRQNICKFIKEQPPVGIDLEQMRNVLEDFTRPKPLEELTGHFARYSKAKGLVGGYVHIGSHELMRDIHKPHWI